MGLKALGIRLGRGQAEGDANAGVPAFDLHFAAEGFNPAAHAHKAGAGVQLAALSVILFIYGWNQYLWPLLITTDPSMNTIVMGIKQMFPSGDDTADWPVIMATSILAMIPPVIVVISMQKLFIRGLVDSEK